MPPKWSLGYQQCRWSYDSDERVREVHFFRIHACKMLTITGFQASPCSDLFFLAVERQFSMLSSQSSVHPILEALNCLKLFTSFILFDIVYPFWLLSLVNLQIARTFREKGIPCDVIWMDIDYMDGFRCFTFDQACALLE